MRGIVVEKHHKPRRTTTVIINKIPVNQTYPEKWWFVLLVDNDNKEYFYTDAKTYGKVKVGDYFEEEPRRMSDRMDIQRKNLEAAQALNQLLDQLKPGVQVSIRREREKPPGVVFRAQKSIGYDQEGGGIATSEVHAPDLPTLIKRLSNK